MLNGIVYVSAPVVMFMILLQISNVWKKWKGLFYLYRPSIPAATFCITPARHFLKLLIAEGTAGNVELFSGL